MPLSLASFSCHKTMRNCNNLRGTEDLSSLAEWDESQGGRLRHTGEINQAFRCVLAKRMQ